MRSPLEILEGRFDHALLTSYSFNLRFFEEWVLPALWAAEVRNIVLFVDDLQLGRALADTHPPKAGQSYHLVASSQARGAFHPKVLLVSGEAGSRLCVSSANLTADGQLRNAESAIAFDSNLSDHERPIIDAGDFFRRLSSTAPAHTAAAIQDALSSLPTGDSKSRYRFLHNLEQPLIESFPGGSKARAITPYVDATGAAASALHERGSLEVVVDGDRIAAGPEFFSGPWSVEARSFDARLHGKAYEVETPQGRWVLVGSPNLTRPGLLSAATDGNLEAAIAIDDCEGLELPQSAPWEGVDLDLVAEERLREGNNLEEDEGLPPRAFDAWEDGSKIIVMGIPDGVLLERWADERWHPLETVNDGAVEVKDPEVRPVRVRAVMPDGSVRVAVVAQPARLRAMARASTRGRQTEATQRLPLDLETVRILEDALSDLYVLSELAGHRDSSHHEVRGAVSDQVEASLPDQLLKWMPRSPSEEPRVPPLYVEAWKGEPDALLALIARVLRIEDQVPQVTEVEVAHEGLSLDDLELEPSAISTSDEDASEINFEEKELERYRRGFERLLERGRDFTVSATDATIAGWAFVCLLTFIEDLGSNEVTVAGEKKPLMPREVLRRITLGLLEGYLRRDDPDPLCLASACVHLALLVRERSHFDALDVKRIDDLAFSWAPQLIDVPLDLPSPPEEKTGLDAQTARLILGDYAERSLWGEITKEAASRLNGGRLEAKPWPVIVGEAEFEKRVDSPAWSMLAFEAPAGFEAMQPFGVIVMNSAKSPLLTHLLVCIPDRHLLIEVFRRESDDVWVERSYSVFGRESVEDLRSPVGLDVVEPNKEHWKFDDWGPPLRDIIPLLQSLSLSYRGNQIGSR